MSYNNNHVYFAHRSAVGTGPSGDSSSLLHSASAPLAWGLRAVIRSWLTHRPAAWTGRTEQPGSSGICFFVVSPVWQLQGSQTSMLLYALKAHDPRERKSGRNLIFYDPPKEITQHPYTAFCVLKQLQRPLTLNRSGKRFHLSIGKWKVSGRACGLEIRQWPFLGKYSLLRR